MTVDELYLENIEEFVNDENKIVTFKWLSQTLQVHCNVAKQMLYKFIENERNAKDRDGFTVSYFVSGLSKPDENKEQAFKCAVVSEEKLESYKSSFQTLTSCHVYSVQKVKLKDTNALYMTDYEKFKENVFESNKYSSIQYDRATLRSSDEMDLLAVNIMPSAEPDKKSVSTSNGNTGSSKTTSKKQSTSALASMFAKADATKKAVKQTDTKKVAVKEEKTEKETDSKTTGKGGNKKQPAGMMAFFSKQTEKKPTPGTAKNENDKVTMEEKKISPMKEKSPAKSKKTPRQQDSDDDENVVKSKRRRIKPDILDSSSEEEDMDESLIPPTPPPKEASPEPEIVELDSPVEEIEEDPIPKKSSPVKDSVTKGNTSNSGERKRKRRKKMVSKTSMDAEGYMVTEKVWEEESTDASEAEEPVKKKTDTKPVKSPNKTGSPQKKPSPSKKGSGKQTSLMSFFKKK